MENTNSSSRPRLFGNLPLAAAFYAAAVLACAGFCALVSYRALVPQICPKLLKAALGLVVAGYYLPVALLCTGALVLLESSERLLNKLADILRAILEKLAEAIKSLPSVASSQELRKASGSAFAGEARRALGERPGMAAAVLILFFATLGLLAPKILKRTPAAAAALAALKLRILLYKAAVYVLALIALLLPPLIFTF